MATIKIKRGTTDPTAAQVTNIGELAANTSTPKLFLKTATDSTTTPVWIGATIESSPSDWTSSSKLATQSAINTTFMPKGGGTFSGDISLSGGSDIRFVETGGGSDYIAFQAPASIATSVTWTLPSADGSNGQVLTTSGTGTLSWSSASASAVAVTSTDTASTVYPIFVTATGSGLTLYADDTTGPLSYVPSTGTMTLAGDINVNGGDIITSATGTATEAARIVAVGAATGTVAAGTVAAAGAVNGATTVAGTAGTGPVK